MRVAIVHYHLRPGGVTRVIENTTRALSKTGMRIVVLCGEPPPADMEIQAPVRVIPELNYAPEGVLRDERELVYAMENAASAELDGAPDLWHFHNHALGKNALLTRAVRQMADKGHRLLLQIHDFAEDGRPHLFETLLRLVGQNDLDQLARVAYPLAGHVHFATINRRDARLLLETGADEEHVHYLPNAVVTQPIHSRPWSACPEADRLVLYPVRAIRRKNLGETLLWCVMMQKEARFAVTLAPKSTSDRVAYDQWVAFAQEHHLPIVFEVGHASSSVFERSLSAAWLVLTTSVAEGFGLTFLEPWLVGRPVVGRDITWLTQEFKENGVELPNLYPRLQVPLDWFDRAQLVERLHSAYCKFLDCYRRSATPDHLAALEHVYMSSGHIDFGRLDEPLQKEVIERVCRDPSCAEQIQPIHLVPDEPAVLSALSRNPAAIIEHYGLDAYGARLQSIYAKVAESQTTGTSGSIDIRRLLDFFLAPEAFWFIRT